LQFRSHHRDELGEPNGGHGAFSEEASLWLKPKSMGIRRWLPCLFGRSAFLFKKKKRKEKKKGRFSDEVELTRDNIYKAKQSDGLSSNVRIHHIML
jgi:hypothetical protein